MPDGGGVRAFVDLGLLLRAEVVELDVALRGPVGRVREVGVHLQDRYDKALSSLQWRGGEEGNQAGQQQPGVACRRLGTKGSRNQAWHARVTENRGLMGGGLRAEEGGRAEETDRKRREETEREMGVW